MESERPWRPVLQQGVSSPLARRSHFPSGPGVTVPVRLGPEVSETSGQTSDFELPAPFRAQTPQTCGLPRPASIRVPREEGHVRPSWAARPASLCTCLRLSRMALRLRRAPGAGAGRLPGPPTAAALQPTRAPPRSPRTRGRREVLPGDQPPRGRGRGRSRPPWDPHALGLGGNLAGLGSWAPCPAPGLQDLPGPSWGPCCAGARGGEGVAAPSRPAPSPAAARSIGCSVCAGL